MPIESEVPLEIERYRKKIAFGLTARQLIGLALALPLAAGAYFLFIHVLGLSIDSGGWLVMLAAMPPLAVGFVRPREEAFERWFLHRVRRFIHPARLYYSARPAPAQEAEIKQKGGANHATISENTFRYRPSGADRKRKRKQTARRVKAAEKEYKTAAAGRRRAQRAARRAERQRGGAGLPGDE